MVDRDDLPDGGASHLKKVIEAIKRLNPGIIIELLSGDLAGCQEALQEVVATDLHVFAHICTYLDVFACICDIFDNST